METKIDLISKAVLMDNMKYMAQFENGFFDLAVVDPPYGIDKLLNRSSYGNISNSLKKYSFNRWDKNIPPKEYFIELFRVSKNQIIWGANYFFDYLNSTRGIICWDKNQHFDNFSAWEMAWTSFDCVARIYKFDNKTGDKIHPTQKPVALYDWIYKNYATAGMKVIDTHLGSGSNRISAYKSGMNFYSCEIDEDYFNDQEKRFANFKSQLNLFY
jgi:site-specific DNA-methyltransferase (adenine-specific)